MKRLAISIIMIILVRCAAAAQESIPPDSAAIAVASDNGDVDRFPYPRGVTAIPVPEGYRGDLDHYIICEAVIDSTGRVTSAQALGCEGGKGILCDRVEVFIPRIPFVPARRKGVAVASRVVFPILFAKGDSVASLGVPVVDDWEEVRCAFTDRIYGADELAAEHRPQVISRGEAEYPFLARAAAQRGEVLLNVIVGPDGIPCFVLCEAVSPIGKGFVESAVDAAYRYTFQPGTKDGVAQSVWVKIPFRWQP